MVKPFHFTPDRFLTLFNPCHQSGSHPMGTAAMARRELGGLWSDWITWRSCNLWYNSFIGVVSSSLKVYGTANLRIVDSSVSYLASNTISLFVDIDCCGHLDHTSDDRRSSPGHSLCDCWEGDSRLVTTSGPYLRLFRPLTSYRKAIKPIATWSIKFVFGVKYHVLALRCRVCISQRFKRYRTSSANKPACWYIWCPRSPAGLLAAVDPSYVPYCSTD